jgi:hypothetical protein
MKTALVALIAALALVAVFSGFARRSPAFRPAPAVRVETAHYQAIGAYQDQVRRYLNEDSPD